MGCIELIFRFRMHTFLPYYYSIKGYCKDGFSYVLYINGGHPPWTLLGKFYSENLYISLEHLNGQVEKMNEQSVWEARLCTFSMHGHELSCKNLTWYKSKHFTSISTLLFKVCAFSTSFDCDGVSRSWFYSTSDFCSYFHFVEAEIVQVNIFSIQCSINKNPRRNSFTIV